MYNLILKDIMIQKKTVLFSLVYVLFFIFAFQKMESAGIISAIVAVTYILVQTACAYEDKDKADVVLNSLPIRKRDIVLSKYLSVYIYGIFGAAAYIAIGAIIRTTGLPVRVYEVTLETAVGTLLAVILYSSLYFPLFFKAGYIKSRVFSLIIFFLFFFGTSFLIGFGKENKDAVPWIGKIAEFFEGMPDIQIAVFIIGAALILQALSCMLSLKLYKSREF